MPAIILAGASAAVAALAAYVAVAAGRWVGRLLRRGLVDAVRTAVAPDLAALRDEIAALRPTADVLTPAPPPGRSPVP